MREREKELFEASPILWHIIIIQFISFTLLNTSSNISLSSLFLFDLLALYFSFHLFFYLTS
jgi:capsule polysaccharide export protein KpsE/RkpR